MSMTPSKTPSKTPVLTNNILNQAIVAPSLKIIIPLQPK